uniref:Coiled-coil domain containing 142 n=1 Tax=Lepisosteus oculatus TaxID=7918 RepID=W5MYQ8_LEPOC
QISFTKSLQKAEALLRNRLNPGLKWLLKQKSDGSGSDVENEDSFISCEGYTSCSSRRFLKMENCVLGLGRQCHVLRNERTGCPQSYVKELSSDCEFYYHPACIALNKHYGKLQHLLEERSQLLLFHEYTRRLKAASAFIANLSGLLDRERLRLNASRQDLESASSFSEYRISTLCEELRIHVYHWSCLRDKARNDNWLRPVLFQKPEILESMKRTLNLVALQALVLMEQYICTVFHVLALADSPDVSTDSLEDVLNGTEIFNSLLSDTVVEQPSYVLHKYCQQDHDWFISNLLKSIYSKRCDKGDSLTPFSIVRLLKIVSKCRGQVAANKLYHWVTNQDALLSSAEQNSLRSQKWENIKVACLQNQLRSVTKTAKTGISRAKVGESQFRSCLSTQTHPLAVFLKWDKDFMDKFCLALVSSTEMIGQHVLNRPTPDKPRIESPGKNCTETMDDEAEGDPNLCKTEEKTNARRLIRHKSEATSILFSQYRTLLWEEFGSALFNILYHPSCNGIFGSLNQCKEQMVFLAVKELHGGCRKALIPGECEGVINDLCMQVISKAAFVHWDQVMCKALGSGQKDKCLPDPNNEGSIVRTTTTTWLLQQLFHPLHTVLGSLKDGGNWQKGNLCSSELTLLSCTVATVHSSSYWAMTKAYQFLSSWSLNQFLLVTQGDLKVLKAEIEKIVPLVEALNLDNKCTPGLTGKLLLQQEKTLLAQLTEGAANIQAFSENVLKIFSTDCKKMAVEIFKQTMPGGKHWRVNCRAELPGSPSEYAASAAHSVLGQVLEGVQPLPDEARALALTEATTAFMEAWMEHILKQKIKFSVQGALQLKQDFDTIRELLKSEEYSLSEEIRQRLLSLGVFHQVDNAIICLLQQPASKAYVPSRTWEPFRRCCSNPSRTRDFNTGSLNSLESMDVQVARNNAIVQAESSLAPELLGKIKSNAIQESYLAGKQQDWLALRIHNGSRWKIPGLLCMNKSNH